MTKPMVRILVFIMLMVAGVAVTAQVPPPPQADGRNILSLDRTVNKVDPGLTIRGFSSSSLMTMLTSPDGTSLDFAYIRMEVRNRMIPTKTKALIITI